jgi:hypothetical protein
MYNKVAFTSEIHIVSNAHLVTLNKSTASTMYEPVFFAHAVTYNAGFL